MSKSINEMSIFGEYKQPENRLTAAFLQVLKVGGEPLIREISNQIGFDIPSSDIDIITQVKENDSNPDGKLECNFTFCLYIESKIGSFNDSKQLKNHLKLLNKEGENINLLYLTGDENRPVNLPKECRWISWEKTISVFQKYLEDTQIQNYELLSFLINQYEILINNLVNINKKWKFKKDKVLIIAGSRAEGMAINYNYYICQNHRRFQDSEYIAFYKNSRISRIYKIASEPEDDVDLNNIPELKNYIYNERKEYNGEKHKVIKLEKPKEIGPIFNDSKDKNGNLCPYTYGQPRYTTIEKIKKAKYTSDL